jgi:hypothetical protein
LDALPGLPPPLGERGVTIIDSLKKQFSRELRSPDPVFNYFHKVKTFNKIAGSIAKTIPPDTIFVGTDKRKNYKILHIQ